MRKFAFSLAVVGLLSLGGAAFAEIGTIDDVPAATLLLPYFEVDLTNPNGINTLFSINNASDAPAVAHVTLWTDMSIPTFDFDIYLTGYDVQTINIRNLFTFGDGVGVPVTADEGVDGGDTISPSPTSAWDDSFPGSTGPCNAPYSAGDNIPASVVGQLALAHTGQFATIGLVGACFGGDFGDNIARGYITVDNVNTCNLSFPSDPGYSAFYTNINQLWGDYFYINGDENFAQGETLVHVEACTGDTPLVYQGVGNGAGYCPFVLGDYTFYGRYALVAGQDQREPLATSFAARYLIGGGFSGATDLIVWRDSKTVPTGGNGPFNCAAGGPAWYPLNQNDVTAFDEIENPEDRCFTGDIFSPPSGGEQTCFPLEAGRYDVELGNILSAPVNPTPDFGWLFLNLNHLGAGVANLPPNVAQNWVTVINDAQGRFSVGYDAIKLDTVLAPTDIQDIATSF